MNNGSPTALDKRRKQAIYRANHRGMKEMDILLGDFAREHAFELNDMELTQFETLLEENDQDLFAWFTGRSDPPHDLRNALFASVLAHRQRLNAQTN